MILFATTAAPIVQLNLGLGPWLALLPAWVLPAIPPSLFGMLWVLWPPTWRLPFVIVVPFQMPQIGLSCLVADLAA